MPLSSSRPDYLLSNALNDLFLRLSKEEMRAIFQELQAECLQRGITYIDDDGASRVIPLMVRPRVINPIQRGYFHYITLQLIDALKRLCALYIHDPLIRKIVPLTEDEEKWLLDAWGHSVPRFHSIVSRLDTNVDFAAKDWRESFQFFEANSVGIGGLYYSSVAENIILEVVAPRLRRLDPDLFLEPNDDMRGLLQDELRLHARSISRPRCHVGLLDDPRNRGGITEYPRLVEYFQAHGLYAIIADPRDVHWRGDEMYCRDTPLDVLYRDVDVRQCLKIEENEGVDLSALRKAFAHNRVVSSLAGEFDHKSCWEVFTDDRFAHYFTPAQWRIFNRHILWTRLIRETPTADDAGNMVDLVPYIGKRREYLVIKPNREFGGVGVTIGPDVTQQAWEQVIQEAVAHPSAYVVQRYSPPRTKQFPIIDDSGEVTSEELFVNCGFVATAKDIGIVGRASRKSVVNVAQQGGLTTVLMILDQQHI